MAIFSLAPIKAIYSRIAHIDEWQFISAGASDTMTVDAMSLNGAFIERLTLDIGTTRKFASSLVDAEKLKTHAWWRVVSVSGTVYGLPAPINGAGAGEKTITTANGWSIIANDRIGLAPNTGTFIVSVGGSSGGSGGDATAANQEEQIAALGNVTDSIAVSAAAPTGDAGYATVVLDGAGGVEYEATADSTFTCTVEDVVLSGGTYRQCGCWQKDTSGNWRHRPPGTTITLVTGERLLVPSDSYGVRIARAGGTVTVSYRTIADPARIMARWQQVELPIGTDGQDTDLSASSALPTIATGATVAYVTIEPKVAGTESAIRFTQDTTTPTSSAGTWKRASGEPFPIYGSTNMSNWRAINALNTCQLSVTYKEEVYKG